MIEKFFTKTFSIYRNDYLELDGVFGSVEDLIGTFKGHLQQAGPQITINLGLNLSTTYTVWCPSDTSVKLGDKIVCEGISYAIRLIQDNSLVGANRHLELVVEKQTDQEADSS
jgi:hypothetical protein